MSHYLQAGLDWEVSEEQATSALHFSAPTLTPLLHLHRKRFRTSSL